ncbi:MAG TPA: hypothetical protein VHX44_02520, partial [Planctomycetota bacterium]|nr:hypothetical protein [Planctomycetota bacterium]
ACLLFAWFAAPQAVAAEKGSAAADKKWFDARAANRKGREGMYQGAAADRIDRAKKAAVVAMELAKKAAELRVPNQDQTFVHVVEFIDRLDPAQADPVKAAFAALPAEPATADAKAVKAWETFFKAKRPALTKPTEVLGQKALDVSVTDIAYDCLQQVLTYDPDHVSLRKALNQTKVDGRYYGPKDMELVKAGLRWDTKLGWLVIKDLARYEKGDYFDLQSKSWTTLDAANTAHSELTKQWVVQTEHLELRGTAKLQELVDAGNKLEAFYSQIFASYSLFFSKGQGDVKLIFGLLDHPRLVINIAKDPAAYKLSLPSGVPAGFSAGMWVPAVGASFFYAGPMEVMYHEFTHQVLDVFSSGSGAPVWVVEGIAVYTQAPTYTDGDLRLGELAKNGMIRTHFRRLTAGNAMDLDTLMALDYQRWVGATDPGQEYSAAGALAQFCIKADKRRYRADYVEFVRDCYLGQSQGHTLWDYLGMTRDDFVYAYKNWEKATGAELAAGGKPAGTPAQ